MFKKGSFVFNATSNVAFFCVNMFVMVWLTPFIVNKLGVDAYGFVPLTLNIIGYVTLFTTIFNSMVTRFITVELKRGNLLKANQYFNTSFVVSFLFSLITLPIVIVCSIWIDKLLNVPSHLLTGVQILFLMLGINLILATIRAPFSTATFFANRFDIQNIIAMVELIVRVGFIIILFFVFEPSLKQLGISYSIAAIITLILTIVTSRNLMPGIKLNMRQFSLSEFKELVSSGTWNAINQLGVILLIQIDLLVANITVGPMLASKYALTLMWPNLIRQFSSTISSVFAPTITHLYAQNDMRELEAYGRRSVGIMGILIGIPIGLLIGFGDKLMALWLGSGFESQYLLLTLMTVQLTIGLPMTSIGPIFTAINKVKYPALITCLIGLINLIAAIILSKTILGIYGIALASGITLLLKNGIFFPIYAAKQFGFKWWTFYIPLKQSLISTIVAVSLSILFKATFYWDSWISLIFCSSLVTILTGLFSLRFLVEDQEYKKSLSCLKVFLNRTRANTNT